MREKSHWCFCEGACFRVQRMAQGDYVQGVWPLPELPRAFYTIAEKPVTMDGRHQGKQVRPEEHYAIPSIQEIVLQPFTQTMCQSSGRKPLISGAAWAI